MSNFLTTVGQMAQGYVPTAMALDARDEAKKERAADRTENTRRYEERMSLERATHAQTGELHGLQIGSAKRTAAKAAEVDNHFANWKAGRQKLAAGDYADVPGFLDNYNSQSGPFNDGATAVMQSTPDGPVINRFGADRKPLDSTKLTPQSAVKMFDTYMDEQLKFMNPEMHQAATTAAASAHQKALDRTSAEKIASGKNQTYLDVANIHEAGGNARSLMKATSGGLTPSQQRSNLEIDDAREAIYGMDPDEVRRRSLKATDSGRENKNYDPSIARAAALANRRKVGTDDYFDKRRAPQQSGDTFSGKPVTDLTEDQLQQYARHAGAEGKAKLDAELTRRRFSGDPTMKGHALGEPTPKGFKVLDAQGRHVGYYNR